MRKLSDGGRAVFSRWIGCAMMASAILTSSQAAAATVCGAYYCDAVQIKQFNVMSDGTVYIEFDGPKSSLNCSLYNGTSVTLLSSANDRLYSFLLTSYIQKLPTMIRINEGSSGCTIMYAA
jgi:outer membrane receptor for monomeric catechols